jgi:hypothetical protein
MINPQVMKTIALFAGMLLTSIGVFSQNAVTTDYKLIVPGEPTSATMSVSKSLLSKIQGLVCKTGEIKGYTISFKINEDLFSKRMENNSLDSKVVDKLLTLPVGANFYLYDISIAGYTQKTSTSGKAQYVLTE